MGLANPRNLSIGSVVFRHRPSFGLPSRKAFSCLAPKTIISFPFGFFPSRKGKCFLLKVPRQRKALFIVLLRSITSKMRNCSEFPNKSDGVGETIFFFGFSPPFSNTFCHRKPTFSNTFDLKNCVSKNASKERKPWHPKNVELSSRFGFHVPSNLKQRSRPLNREKSVFKKRPSHETQIPFHDFDNLFFGGQAFADGNLEIGDWKQIEDFFPNESFEIFMTV